MPQEPKTDALIDPEQPNLGPLVDWFEHRLERDWGQSLRHLASTKALAVGDCLDHLKDIESLTERDNLEEIARDIRNLSSRLRSLQKDYEHEAAVGG